MSHGEEKKPKVSIDRVREIVRQQIVKRVHSEGVDHKGISDVVHAASKLLGAVEAFKEKAPPSALNALVPMMDQLERTLEDMVSTPGSYVLKPKPEMKKVSLRAVKEAIREAAGTRSAAVMLDNLLGANADISPKRWLAHGGVNALEAAMEADGQHPSKAEVQELASGNVEGLEKKFPHTVGVLSRCWSDDIHTVLSQLKADADAGEDLAKKGLEKKAKDAEELKKFYPDPVAVKQHPPLITKK